MVEIAVPYRRAVDKTIEIVQTYEADAIVMATHCEAVGLAPTF